jgi:hypothetical protein
MKSKTKEMLLIKSGDYVLDLSKLVFGGVVLSVIMQIEYLDNTLLLIAGCCSVILTAILGIYFIIKSQSNKKKGE